MKDFDQIILKIATGQMFPSPCGVSGMKAVARAAALQNDQFPSPCGVGGMKVPLAWKP